MITGHTSFIAHIGYPTTTFRAPMIYNPYFEKNDIDCIVVPMGCKAEDFPAFLPAVFRLTNIRGALITMPHKVSVLEMADHVLPAAKIAGASNAIRREADGTLTADMFDGEGFARGVERKGQAIAGKRVLVVGAGGVGSAIAASLAARSPAELMLFDVNASTAEKLAARLRQHYPALAVATGSNDPAGFDIVVNATPLGMNEGDPMPMEIGRIEPSAFVGEVVLKKEMTAFLTAAAARGCRVQIGLDMLFEMIPAYLEFFGFPSASADELRAVARFAI